MKVIKTEIPADSLCRNYLPADYTDVYSCETDSAKAVTADDIMVGFWTDMPGWADALFRLRDFLARFAGLKGSGGGAPEEFEKCIRSGCAYRFASVPAKNGRETVLLLSDKHLDAHMSVYTGQGSVSVITLVHFRNRLGRIYFFAIRPFHGLVVKNMLKRAVAKVVG